MEKNYGLLYTDKNNIEYLYKSCYTLEEVIKVIQSDSFKKVEKKKILIIKLEDSTVKEVKVEGEVK